MKGVLKYALLLLAASSCISPLAPEDPSSASQVRVKVVMPEKYAGVVDIKDVTVKMQSGSLPVSFTASPDADSCVTFKVSQDRYSILASYYNVSTRVSVAGRSREFILTGEDLVYPDGSREKPELTVNLSVAVPSPIVIREFYYHGSTTSDGSSSYTKDRYVEIFNNNGEGGEVYYLDSLCIAGIFPYNSTASNTAWTDADTLAIGSFYWIVPGRGHDYPLAPGESAVIALIAAVDHSGRSSSGLHLERAHFGCYDEGLSGHEIDARVPKMIRGDGGQGTAWAVSIHSPAFVLFRPEMGLAAYRADAATWEKYEPGKTSGTKYWHIASSWILDGVECYDSSVGALKRLPSSVDVSYAMMKSSHYSGKCIRRRLDEVASTASVEVYMDTNNSLADFITDADLSPRLKTEE